MLIRSAYQPRFGKAVRADTSGMRLRRHAPAELARPGASHRIASQKNASLNFCTPDLAIARRPGLNLPKSEITPGSEPNGRWLFFSIGGKLGYNRNNQDFCRQFFLL